MEDFIADYILKPLMVVIFVVILVLFGALIACVAKEVTCDRVQKEITEIGGCNRYECGVRYGDGSTGNESSPVVGEIVSVCK